MSANWDESYLARMLALEHAFGAISLMWAGMYASNAGCKPSEAVKLFKDSVLSSLYDGKDRSADIISLEKAHLENLLGNLEKMAALADKGYEK